MYHKFLLQVITIIIILARIDIPTPYLISIHSIEVLVSNKRTPVILCQKSPISLLPRFILHIGRIEILAKWRKHVVFDIGPSTRKRGIIESPKRPELTQSRKCLIDKILVCASQIVVNNPVEVSFFGCEFHVDPIRSRVRDGCGGPI
jgi:hypothetical protein